MPTPITDPDLLAQLNAPERAPVAGSQRVWGDKEAEAAGLYETPQRTAVPRPVNDPQLLAQLNSGVEIGASGRPRITITPFRDRAEIQPQENPQLGAGLERRALEMQRGPERAPGAQMATDFQNVLSAASQGTVPHVDQYGGRLVSADVQEGDDGNVYYRDPQNGQVLQADSSKQVALRDPQDGRVKLFERSAATNENSLVGASRVLNQGMVAGAPTARPAIPLPSVASATPRASEVISTAKPYYQAFDAAAANATPVAANDAKVMVDRVQNALDTAHLPSEVAKQVHDTVGLIGKKGDTQLSQLQYVKRAIGNLFKSPDPNVRAGAGVASKEINRMISEISREAGQNLTTADEIHSTAKSLQDLQRKREIAGLRAGRAGYGGNAVNSMRQVLSPIVQRSIEGKITGFRPNEIQAMRDIIEGNWATNLLRGVGSMSPTKGIIANGIGISTAGVTSAIGAAANKLATVLTGKQIGQLMELVAKRSPEYSKAVAKATERYEKAQMDFVNNPAPNKFAAYVSASRALSSGLSKDGIQIASGDLLRAIQGPMKSAADDEQPKPEGVGNR